MDFAQDVTPGDGLQIPGTEDLAKTMRMLVFSLLSQSVGLKNLGLTTDLRVLVGSKSTGRLMLLVVWEGYFRAICVRCLGKICGGGQTIGSSQALV